MPVPYFPTTKDGRAVSQDNRLRVLQAVRHFGHLRRQEIAMAAWPRSSSRSAYIMAARTVRQMLAEGLLLERINSLGGASLVLAARGVSRLRDMDIKAQEGYELAFDGPQFFHRTLGTCYLLEKARAGDEVFGEYALMRGWSPVDMGYAREHFLKVPDGLVVYSGASLGLRDGVRLVDWVEVESAAKPYDEIKKALRILAVNSSMNKAGTLVLNKLVFVCDSRQRHEQQILRHIKRFLTENPQLSYPLLTQEIIIARCFVDVPLAWHGVEELVAYELMRDMDPDSGTDFD